MNANLFYFRKISAMGGTEQFLYEIAKKYGKYDIIVLYDQADTKQLRRLSKFIKTKKRRPGEIYECKRAFFNFNIDAINQVESSENYYAFVFHANFEELGTKYEPPVQHPKLNHFIGVSQFATDKGNEWLERLGRKERCELCYNPLTLEKPQKVIRLLSACRLDDVVKGGERTKKLINALDKYSFEHNRQYIWTIFTNLRRQVNEYESYDMRNIIKSPNVVLLEPRLDIRSYIADSTYVAQLSNDMETYCYTINEALGYGVPIITTPLSILKELPITDNEHIVLNWDCSNADEVAKEIFEKKVKPFEYKILEDDWDKLIVKTKSKYKNEKVKVQCTARNEFNMYYDVELMRSIKNGEIVEMDDWRVDGLEELELVKRI